MLKLITRKIWSKISLLDEHTLEVIKKSSASFFVKIASMIIGLGVSVFLGRTIGAEGLGIINIINKVIGIILIIGLLGSPQVIIKEIAIAHDKNDWQHIGNIIHTSYILSGGLTAVISILLIILSPWISNHIFHEPKLTFPLMISLLVTTPQIISRILSSALIGYKKIWQSNLVDQTLSVVVVGVLLGVSFILGKKITINLVIIYYVIGKLIVTITMYAYWRKLYNFKQKKVAITRYVLKTSIPLLFVAAALTISASIDTIMLGWLTNSKEVGLFSVALRIALLTSFFIQLTISTLSPKIAALYAKGEKLELERMVQRVTKGLSLIGLIILIVTIVFGKQVLILWGKDFSNAYLILVILSIGQFFNIATGPVGNLLAMTGREKLLRNITVGTLLLNIVLNYFFIIKLHAVGAAISTTITIALTMILSTIIVKRELGFYPLKFWN